MLGLMDSVLYDDKVTIPLSSQWIFPKFEVLSESFDKGASQNGKTAAQVSSNMGIAFDYYKKIFNRDSFDNKNGPINIVWYEDKGKYPFEETGVDVEGSLAAFNCENNKFMFADIINLSNEEKEGYKCAPGLGLDVVAHEFTHSVIYSEAQMIYKDQSGAIDEALSDLFGELVQYWHTKEKGWTCGEDVYTSNIRSLAKPSERDTRRGAAPDHFSQYDASKFNSVHNNSGIIGKAGYLLSEGGEHHGVKVEGVGMEKMGQILYHTITNYLVEKTDFSALRTYLIQSATELFGSNGEEVQAVTKAFEAVGVK